MKKFTTTTTLEPQPVRDSGVNKAPPSGSLSVKADYPYPLSIKDEIQRNALKRDKMGRDYMNAIIENGEHSARQRVRGG